jgi:entericidin B
MLKLLARLLALSCLGLALSACNTIEGAGKDVKAAGGAVEKAAKSTKTY